MAATGIDTVKRALLSLVLGLWASLAFAQSTVPPQGFALFPCPQTTIGWALQWPASAVITSASYDSGTQILYIVFNYTNAQAFTNVPIGIIQSLSHTQNPLAIYNGSIGNTYHQALLTEKDNCVFYFEANTQPTHYFWTQ